MNAKKQTNTVNGFIWRLMQNASSQVISFVIQIILARILIPADYAITAVISVFISIANVFISTGFSSALIQKKDITEADLSTAFYSGIIMAAGLYGILYVSAPYIATFYEMQMVSPMLRVQSLCIPIGALYSIQQTLLTKYLQFKKSMLASVSAGLVQGIVGISMALCGFGAWSLVISSLINYVVICIVLWLTVRWKPQLVFSMTSSKRLISFSVKILMINLINTFYNNLKSLIIGKAYDTNALAFYNRGFQLPSLVMTNVDGAMTTVLFSSLSRLQDEPEAFMYMLRKSMRTSLYVCAPLMLGMAAVAEPMILVLLTEKWAEAIPFVQLCCWICLMWPMSAITHAVIAKGMSSVALRLNIMSKTIGIACLVAALPFGVYSFVMSGLISSILCQIVAAFVYKKTLGYSILNQITDIIKPTWRAVVMMLLILPINRWGVQPIIKLAVMVPSGVVTFILLSVLVKSEEFDTLLSLLKQRLNKK